MINNVTWRSFYYRTKNAALVAAFVTSVYNGFANDSTLEQSLVGHF